MMMAAGARTGVAVTITVEGPPPELPLDHPLVRLACDLTGQAPRTAPLMRRQRQKKQREKKEKKSFLYIF